MQRYNPKQIEPEILSFWSENKIYEKVLAKLKDKPGFFFLDGPPYVSGEIHVGHAWNKALKDALLRYKRASGFNVFDVPGFDMHGLPIEHAVEVKLGIKDKREIVEKIGIDKFIQLCKEFAIANMAKQIEDFKRMGVWMAWDRPYMTISDSYIQAAWWALAEAARTGHLYKGIKVMTWCPRCSTALAKHELEYKTVKERSIFVKFPLAEKGTFLIVWTTTPWTIPFNLAVMANPELDYVKAKVENEKWILAKALATSVIQAVAGKSFEVLEEFKGTALKGVRYKLPFVSEVPKLQELYESNPAVGSVVLSSEYVSAEAGTGLVHCAPGCGPEDFEVGTANNIPPFNNIDERGIFFDMGQLTGLVAKKNDSEFVERLKQKGLLIAETEIEHEYAHCWRCESPVIFRPTEQWFFGLKELREKFLKANEGIKWVPSWAGKRWFASWLASLSDWCISRQRFWGIPLPIWVCKNCGASEVIGSAIELEKRAGKAVAQLHRPWVDEIKLNCGCGWQLERIPDVLDVWFDSAVAPWAVLGWPESSKYREFGYAADLIIEGKDQIRGWFNTLFCLSMLVFGQPSYKSVYMHGFINDALGRKMSKSLGNVISPYEIIEKYGADAMRFYFISGADPGLDMNYNFKDAAAKFKSLDILWNLHSFVLDLASELGKSPTAFDDGLMETQCDVEERWILSRLNTTLKAVTEKFESYELNVVPSLLEQLLFDLSRTYIQLIREKVVNPESKAVVLWACWKVLFEMLKMFSPLTPFIAEKVYQNFRQAFGLEVESISEYPWPKPQGRLINKELESKAETAVSVLTAILAARQKAGLNIRWPVLAVEVVSTKPEVQAAIEEFEKALLSAANIKALHFHTALPEVKEHLKPNFEAIKESFGKDPAGRIIGHLAMVSEQTILRHLRLEGRYLAEINREEFELLPEHFIFEKEIPKHFVEASFKGGFVYLNKDRTDQLEAEGYAREIARRVQELRKQAKLVKTDKINLYLHLEEELAELLRPQLEQIGLRCGAAKVEVLKVKPVKRHLAQAEEKIKEFSIGIYFDKVAAA